MSSFKKSFRGYRVSEVNARLQTLETEITSWMEKCKTLENQLTQAKQEEKEAHDKLLLREEQLSLRERELTVQKKEVEKIKREYGRLLQEQSQKKDSAESIGRLYLKAFESGCEIAYAPKPHVEQFLGNIESATKEAQREFFEAKQKFSSISAEFQTIISQIQSQSDFLRQRFENLSEDVEKIETVYAKFDEIKAATKSDIEGLQKKYEELVHEYSEDATTSSEAQSQQGFSFVPRTDHKLEKTSAARMAFYVPEQQEEIKENSEPKEVHEDQTQVIHEEQQESKNSVTVMDSKTPMTYEEQEDKQLEESVQSTPSESVAQVYPDTYDDFRDEQIEAEKQAFVNEMTNAAGAETAKTNELIRGQNVLNLLNKYKKS